jgi:hypothetical protein
MTIIKSLSAGLVAVSVCIAQITVNISGKVTDSAGVGPIAGAIVKSGYIFTDLRIAFSSDLL